MQKSVLSCLAFLLLLLAVEPALAQSQATGGQAGTMQLVFGTLQFIGIGFFVYYMLVILPRNTQEAEHKKFLDNLKKGDEVVTSGGLLGKVSQVKEEAITLELSSSVKVRVLPTNVRVRASSKQVAETSGKKAANNK